MSEDKIQSALEWLKEQVATLSYGEIKIELVIHGGQVRRIEKGLIIKEQETPAGTGVK